MTDNIQSEEGSSEKETMAKGACATNTSTSLRKIPDYKRRMIHTAVFYYGYFVFGWVMGQRGAAFLDLLLMANTDIPTGSTLLSLACVHMHIQVLISGWVIGQRGAAFLDLLLVTDTNVATGSILFTLAGLASVGGGLAGGFLLDLTGRPLLMMTCVFLVNAAVNSTLALCKPLALMSTLFFFSSFALSVCDVASNPLLASIWPGTISGGVLQGLHFTFSVGAVLSPIATEPFLAPRSEDTHLIPIEDLEKELAGNSEQVHDDSLFSNNTQNVSVFRNVTELLGEDAGLGAVKETKVFYALLLSGSLSLICAVLMSLLKLVPVQYLKHQEKSEGEGEMASKERKLYCAALVMLGVYNFFSSSVEDVFPHYLMTFVVRQLDWSKSSGAGVTSVYWVGLAVGRLSGVWLVRWLSPTRLITGCLTSMMFSLVAVLLASIFQAHWAVWVSAGWVGLSTSTLFPTGLVYAHQRVSHLTGKVSSIIFTTPMIAAMVNPMVLATLMTRYSNLWYVYIFMMQVVIAMTCFLILHRVTVKLASCRRSTQKMQLEISGELDKNQETCQPFLEKSTQDL